MAAQVAGFPVVQPFLLHRLALIRREPLQAPEVSSRLGTLFRGESAPFPESRLHAFLLDGGELRKSFGHAEQLSFLELGEIVPLGGNRCEHGPLLRAQFIPLRCLACGGGDGRKGDG